MDNDQKTGAQMMNRLRQKSGYYFRKSKAELLFQLGGGRLPNSQQASSRIVLYHGIDTAGRTDINGRFLSVRKFEKQLRYFKEHFNILPLTSLFSDEGRADKMNIAICFDDGYRNNLSLALPLLEKLNIPATFFITAINDTPYPMLWADYLDLATYLSNEPIRIDDEVYRKRKGNYWNASGIRLKQQCKTHDWSFKQKIYIG